MDHGGLPGDVPDLLSGIIALHWHRYCVACSSLLPLLFASFLAPIRARLGCVEKNPGSGDDGSATRANDRSSSAAGTERTSARYHSASTGNSAARAKSPGTLAL